MGIWNGDINGLTTTGAILQRPGGTGDIVETYGSAAEPSEISAVNWATTRAGAYQAKEALEKLRHQVVPVVDGHGVAWPLVLIESISVAIRATARHERQRGLGGGMVLVSHRIEVRAVLRAQEGPENV